MKCPKCGGTGEMQICEMGFIGKDECDKCHGKGYLNNDEWLQTCTTEQLAEFLYDIAYFDNWSDAIMNDSLINETAVEDAIEKWLKQPHTNKE